MNFLAPPGLRLSALPPSNSQSNFSGCTRTANEGSAARVHAHSSLATFSTTDPTPRAQSLGDMLCPRHRCCCTEACTGRKGDGSGQCVRASVVLRPSPPEGECTHARRCMGAGGRAGGAHWSDVSALLCLSASPICLAPSAPMLLS